MAYFDAGTAQALNASGRRALLEALDDGWADPRRLHREGRRARSMIDDAAAAMAALLQVRPDELVITASDDDAVRAAVDGLSAAARRRPGPVLASAVERGALLAAVAAANGAADAPDAEHLLPVDHDGLIRRDRLDAALAAAPRALVLQAANQETGVRQDLGHAAEACAAAAVPLLVDASAPAGREALPVEGDVLLAAPRAWGGPGGVGVVVVRTGTRWAGPGGSGTRWHGAIDVPAVVSAAAALEESLTRATAGASAMAGWSARLAAAVAEVPDAEHAGRAAPRVPHLLTFSCLYVAGEAVVDALDRQGFSVASGSACADVRGPSHVLAAMGLLTQGNVRIGIPVDARDEDVESLARAIPATVAALRAASGTAGL